MRRWIDMLKGEDVDDGKAHLALREGLASVGIEYPLPGMEGRTTTSVDRALALLAKARPGWILDHLGDDATGDAGFGMRAFGGTAEITDGTRTVQGQASTKALAIHVAILRSIEDVAS